jgi:hypothetical protein
MKSENALNDAMKKLKKAMQELKKAVDETGADIENYSMDYKLYLEDDEKENDEAMQHATAGKRKNIFEEKSNKDRIFK